MAHAIFSQTQQVCRVHRKPLKHTNKLDKFERGQNIILYVILDDDLLILPFQLPAWLKENEFWINMFAYSHAMINPIIYITFNENFKKSFKKFLLCSNEVIPCEYSRNCKYKEFYPNMKLWNEMKS